MNDEWHILSDSELVKRARRLTIVGLVVGAGFLALAGWTFSSSPVVEQGGPARAVHIPYHSTQVKASAPPTAEARAAAAALPPNPWTPKPATRREAPRPAPPQDGKIWNM